MALECSSIGAQKKGPGFDSWSGAFLKCVRSVSAHSDFMLAGESKLPEVKCVSEYDRLSLYVSEMFMNLQPAQSVSCLSANISWV